MSKRKSYGPIKRKKGPRINHQITDEQIRVVMEGEATEIMGRARALELAASKELDLVEVSQGQKPPVCKIINFGKWKYEQQKKRREQSKHQHVVHIKEIKLRPKIGSHDYEIKLSRAVSFLEKGNKVKVSLRFRGREMAHPDLGMKLMHKLAEDANDAAIMEQAPKMEGRQIVMVLGSRGKKKDVSNPKEKKELDEKRPLVETEPS